MSNLVLPPLPAQPSNAMSASALMAPVRAAVPRASRSGPINIGRTTNFEAAMGQMVGAAAVSACTHCANGHGPFAVCVTVAGHFGGSCANCHYGSSGSRCSLRPQPAGPATPPVAAPATPATPATPGNSGASASVSGWTPVNVPGFGLGLFPQPAPPATPTPAARNAPATTGTVRLPVEADVTAYDDQLDEARNMSRSGRWAVMANLHLRLAAVAAANAEEEDDEDE